MAATQRKASDPLPREEVYGPSVEVPDPKLVAPTISYGLHFDEAVLKHVPANARVYVLVSKTLSEKTNHFECLKKALGARLVGQQIGMTPHTIYQECLEVVRAAKSVSTNLVMTLGAGSLADAAKFICNALTNQYKDLSDLEAAEAANHENVSKGTPTQHGKMPFNQLILIPTSLSGGEHTPYSGITDRETKRKYQIYSKQAEVTILDPWLCLDTPLNIWIQSGVRGIDHCIETIVSTYARPEGIETACKGLELLIPGLFKSKLDTEGKDVVARLNAQIGVSLAILNICWLIPMGASHAIGHMLGPMGVGHGETSCILLPAVCKYNAEAKEHAERQSKARQVLWDIPDCKELFQREGLTEDKADLGDLLDKVIRELGMPRTLKERGVEGKRVRELAEVSLKDFWLKTNPRPITDADEVMKILDQVRG